MMDLLLKVSRARMLLQIGTDVLLRCDGLGSGKIGVLQEWLFRNRIDE